MFIEKHSLTGFKVKEFDEELYNYVISNWGINNVVIDFRED